MTRPRARAGIPRFGVVCLREKKLPQKIALTRGKQKTPKNHKNTPKQHNNPPPKHKKHPQKAKKHPKLFSALTREKKMPSSKK